MLIHFTMRSCEFLDYCGLNVRIRDIFSMYCVWSIFVLALSPLSTVGGARPIRGWDRSMTMTRGMGAGYGKAICDWSSLGFHERSWKYSYALRVTSVSHKSRGQPLHCIDKKFKPLDPVAVDADDTWRTKASTIVTFDKTPLKSRPELVTFDAVGTLISPSQSIGRWYREALNSVCDMRIRLPRPAHFTNAFNKAFADM